jgi:hypothetical protein
MDEKDEPKDKRKEREESGDEPIPLPPDQLPVEPIQDPPARHEKGPIDEGPKGPKKIV